VDDAVEAGCVLCTGARVKRVLVEDGRVCGVEGKVRGKPFLVKAETVVLAAGGIGSPRILQASGFEGAGQGMTMDITVMVCGTIKGKVIGK
jgi:choline dehydrogenase-like flavoprotein